ncbi:MAG: DNRLRE domain-containing protein, partial [Bacteroidia bacterium]|nr:DNRLRE domain-containing protein [Bacteroidia bacterium]
PMQISAQSVDIFPAKDNTLYESATGALSNGSGTNLFVGNTNVSSSRRAVLQFDISSSIPVGATITSATLTMTMNQTIAGPTNVSLHTLTADWGEGSSVAGGGQGGGGASQPNDATWIHRFFSSTNWATPGGDFTSTASATTSVAGAGVYSWTSAQLTTDVQAWFANPSNNFGWIAIGNEATNPTAKRFASREAGSSTAPKLTVTYTVPCVEPDVPTLSAPSTSICPGQSATITVNGNLNDATSWRLYSGTCGGTLVSSNATGVFSVSPATTTNYFVRGEGGCTTPGACATITITVLTPDVASLSYPGGSAYCSNDPDISPVITGTQGGSYSSTPAGLGLNPNTGLVSPSVSSAGTYSITYTSPGACPATSSISVTILPSFDQTIPVNLCEGDSLVLGTQVLKTAGTFTELFSSKDGCDSTVTVNLTFSPGFVRNTDITVCQGDTVFLGTQVLTSTGTYVEVFPSTTGGCDTTETLVLTVAQPVNGTDAITLCPDEIYQFGTQIIDGAGTFTEVFATVDGCDSTIVLTVTEAVVDTSVTLVDGNTARANTVDASFQWIDCATNLPVSGATMQEFTPVMAGSFAVIVSQEGCSDTSSCYTLSGTDAIDQAFQATIRLSPNPTTGVLKLDLGNSFQQVTLQVMNLQGQLLQLSGNSSGQTYDLDLSGLPAGLYLLHVVADEKVAVIRVRKE